MRLLQLLLIYILLPLNENPAFAQDHIFPFNKPLSAADFELKGKVKLIIENQVIPENGKKINNKGKCETLYRFNDKLFLTEEITSCYTEYDSIIHQSGNRYQYDYTQDSIKVTVFSVDSSGFRVIRYYDSTNKIISALLFKKNKLIAKSHFHYDKHGNITCTSSEDFPHSSITEKSYTYIFDENKQISIIEMSVSGANHKEKNIFSYNNKNQIEKIRTEYNNEEIFDEKKYKYDDRGNVISEEFFGVSESIGYNGEGFLEAYKDTTRSITTFQLKYDEKGNWIKKTRISDGTEIFSLFRKIEYYD
ncbi:MAG: hypothetical protein ACOZCO_10060 [Bacteroidota bacterium]